MQMGTVHRSGVVFCPLCDAPLKKSELESHYQHELRELLELGTDVTDDSRRSKRAAAFTRKQSNEAGSGSNTRRRGNPKGQLDANEMILFTVRSNRAKRMQRNRVGQLTTPRPVTAGTDSGVCPMCGDPLPQDHDAINTHVDLCLSGGGPVDTEGRVEEYTWAGQTRVRATALMEGDYAASGFVVHKKTDRDTDEDVDIDNDDEQAFGDAQYGEQDLQAVSNEPSKEQDNIVNIRASLGIDDEEGIDIETYRPEDVDLSVLHNVAPSSKLIIESLKERVRDLESHTRTAPKCLICLEPYKDPVVSIICWHVHCEKCWLQTLAAKKLCPQDSRITSASDLRRIYF